MCNYPTKFPCTICAKDVSENVKAVQCDVCEYWVYIKCNNLKQIFPFNSLSSNKNFMACCTNTDNNTAQWIHLENDISSLSLKPSNLELLVNQFNNATPENNNDPEKICSSIYYDIVEMGNTEIPPKKNCYPCFI